MYLKQTKKLSSIYGSLIQEILFFMVFTIAVHSYKKPAWILYYKKSEGFCVMVKSSLSLLICSDWGEILVSQSSWQVFCIGFYFQKNFFYM